MPVICCFVIEVQALGSDSRIKKDDGICLRSPDMAQKIKARAEIRCSSLLNATFEERRSKIDPIRNYIGMRSIQMIESDNCGLVIPIQQVCSCSGLKCALKIGMIPNDSCKYRFRF